MTLNFKQGKQSKKVKYVLKNREMAGDKRIGFSNEDVLYMLMPVWFRHLYSYPEYADARPFCQRQSEE